MSVKVTRRRGASELAGVGALALASQSGVGYVVGPKTAPDAGVPLARGAVLDADKTLERLATEVGE